MPRDFDRIRALEFRWLVVVLALGCSRRKEHVPPPLGAEVPLAAAVSDAGPPDAAASARVGAERSDGGARRPEEDARVSMLVVDGAGAHWAKSDGTIYGQSTGTKQPRILAHLPSEATGLALGRTRLFATYLEYPGDSGALVAIPRSGGVPTVLSKLEQPTALAVDDTSAYVASKDDVYAISLATGDRRPIAHLSVSSLALDETNVFMTTESNVVRVSKQGGRSTELAEGLQDSSTSILVVLDRLYFVSVDEAAGARSLCWIPKAGRPKLPPETFYVGAGTRIWSSAVHAATDGVDVFWTSASDDPEHPEVKLLRRTRGSQVNTEIARGLADTTIAVSGSGVYWVTPAGIESVGKTRSGPVAVDPNL